MHQTLITNPTWIAFVALGPLLAYVVWTVACLVMAVMACVGPFVLSMFLFEKTRQRMLCRLMWRGR